MTGIPTEPKTRPVRVGVCGMGFIGPAHVEALRRVTGVEVVAVSSTLDDRRDAVARRFGIPRVYASHEALIDDPDVDAVHICTRNQEHFSLTKRAIEAGKHVVCEKPLAAAADQARALADLAEGRKGVGVYAVNYQYRYYPLVQQARAMVRSGQLGSLHLIFGHYVQDWLLWPSDYNWRVDPDLSGPSRAFADIGSHWCDLVEYVTGERIVRVAAVLRTVIPERERGEAPALAFDASASGGATGRAAKAVKIDTEDVALVHFETDRGTSGSLVVSQVSAGHKNDLWLEINGSEASLSWRQESPEQLWIGRRDASNCWMTKEAAQLAPEAARAAHYPAGHPEGYPDSLKNLFEAVYERVRDPQNPARYPTFADGLRMLELTDAVLASSRRAGAWADVSSPGGDCDIRE